MPDVIATNAALARKGIDKILSIEAKRLPDYAGMMGFKDISNSQRYIRIQQEAGFGLFTQTTEFSAHPEVTLESPYSKDFYWNIYKMKYAISEEAMAADQYGRQTAGKIGSKLALSLNQTKNSLSAQVIVGGFAGTTGPDGVVLFSASHPLATGTSSNLGSADISATELTTAVQAMMSQKDHKGQPFLCQGPYTLVVPVGNMVAAKVLKESLLLPGSPNNDKNVQGMMVSDVIVNPYLTDADSWFLVDKEMADGLHRLVFSMGVKNRNKLNEDLNAVEFFSSFRESYGFHDWRGVWGSPGA